MNFTRASFKILAKVAKNQIQLSLIFTISQIKKNQQPDLSIWKVPHANFKILWLNLLKTALIEMYQTWSRQESDLASLLQKH